MLRESFLNFNAKKKKKKVRKGNRFDKIFGQPKNINRKVSGL